MPAWLRVSIGGAATLLLGMGLGRFSYTPLIPALVLQDAISEAQAGSVAAFNLAGFLVGAVAAPWLGRWLGERRTLRLSLVVSLLCLVASIPPWGFAWLAAWRFLVGAATAAMMIYALAVVTRSAPHGRLGAATGITFTGVGIGVLLAGMLVPWLLGFGLAVAWAGLAGLGGVACLVGLWGWTVVPPQAEPERAERVPDPTSAALDAPLRAAAVRLTLAQTAFALGLIPHTFYWVDYLVRGLGLGIGTGGSHWALFGLGAVGGTYVWGRFADRIGFRVGLAAVFTALAIGVAMPVIHPAGWILILSSLVVGAQPGLSAIISGRTLELVGAARMAQVWRWMTLGSGVGQTLGSFAYVQLFAATGSYVPIFLAGGTAMATGVILVLTLKKAPPKP